MSNSDKVRGAFKEIPSVDAILEYFKDQLKSKTTEEISKATGGFGIPNFKWPL